MESREIYSLACEVYKSQEISDYTSGCIDGFCTGFEYGKDLDWKTGDPTEFGEYLTTREKRDGTRVISVNQWATSECCNYPPPVEGWQVGIADGSKIIGWVKISDLPVMRI